MNLNLIRKALGSLDFIRPANLLKTGLYYGLEAKILKRTLSYPKVINLLTTLRCNLRCQICHTQDSLTNSSQGELSLDELKQFFDECQSFKPDWFFSGGEPFARKDFGQILEHLNGLQMKASAVSNGLLLEESILQKIPKNSLSGLFISVLGVGDGHDKEVLKPGAYIKLLENVRRMHRHSPKTAIYLNVPLTLSILQNLKQFRSDIQTLPIKGLRFSHLNYLTSEEEKAYQSYISRFGLNSQKAWSWVTDQDFDTHQNLVQKEFLKQIQLPYKIVPDLDKDEIKSWYTRKFISRRPCHFIWHSTYIYPDGSVKSCHFLQEQFGNIRDTPLKTIWNSPNYQKFRQTIQKEMSPACARCCKL